MRCPTPLFLSRYIIYLGSCEMCVSILTSFLLLFSSIFWRSWDRGFSFYAAIPFHDSVIGDCSDPDQFVGSSNKMWINLSDLQQNPDQCVGSATKCRSICRICNKIRINLLAVQQNSYQFVGCATKSGSICWMCIKIRINLLDVQQNQAQFVG